VDRDKQVGIPVLRILHTLLVLNVDIPVTDQHSTHAGLSVYPPSKVFADREHHVLFFRAPPQRTRIMSAMTRIDCDHDIAPRPILLGCTLDRCRSGRVVHIDNQPVAVRRIGSGRKCPGANSGVEIENNSQLSIGAHCAAD